LDSNRFRADSYNKYKLYFNPLHEKMQEYEVEAGNVYNVNEKDFMLGTIGRSKRVFSRQSWEAKSTRQAVQDGSRECIIVSGCCCADGSVLDPALIYQGTKEIQSSWVREIEAEEHPVFVRHSPSVWTNNELRIAWLKQVFDRKTEKKARRRWRLLIVDSHGSHLTLEFLNLCLNKRILLIIFPPHATYTLQPLDVVLYGPLSGNYRKVLTTYLHNSLGLLTVKKGDFFPLF
jgi:hypothetical protein